MQVITSIVQLVKERSHWGESGRRLAFVPTMGALHPGHVSLMEKARQRAEFVVASIFVNPMQFGPHEDFARYPRPLESDLQTLRGARVDDVFLPDAAEMYGAGFTTFVDNRAMASHLCGASRHDHFRGVLTVVLKLFNLIRPHTAVFGKKDYQQWRLIETMSRDLNLDVTVIGADIVREADGLAMSSRNRYLSPYEREIAPILFRALKNAQSQFSGGDMCAERLMSEARHTLRGAESLAVEYLEICRQEDLVPLTQVTTPAVLLAAVRLGKTRLIDNIELQT